MRPITDDDDGTHAAIAADLEAVLDRIEPPTPEKDREVLLGDVKSRAQRQGLINLRHVPDDIRTARRENLNHAQRHAKDTPPPTTEAEREQLRRAQDKRDRRRTHRRGNITTIEADRG